MPTKNSKNFVLPKTAKPSRREITDLHVALAKLRIPVAPEEVRRSEIGKTTKAAIKELQQRHNLPPTGSLGKKTASALKADLDHVFFSANKTRTAKLHEMLG